MSGDPAAVAVRALLSLWALASGAAAVAGLAARRPRRRLRETPPPAPSREGPDALAAILRAAAEGSLARERAASRMAALARDAVALELGLDDEAAWEAARAGALDSSPALRDLIERDYLAEPPGRGGAFIRETTDALNELEKLRDARRGED